MYLVPATYNLDIQKGDDFSFIFDIQDNGVTLDLTGKTILSQIRTSRDSSSTLIISFTVATDEQTNEITLSLTDEQTSAITHSNGYYDVLVINGTDKTHYFGGTVNFLNTCSKVIV
jgi:hypothetical protein